MENYIKTCSVSLTWPPEVKQELENTLGKGASNFNKLELEPDFALNLRTGDILSFIFIHTGGYPYIKDILPDTVHALGYLAYQGFGYYTVADNRRFTGNVLYINLDLILNRDLDKSFSDAQRADYFDSPIRFNFIDYQQFNNTDRERYLNALLLKIKEHK